MKRSENIKRVSLAGLLVAALFLGACASGTMLKGNDVDTARMEKIHAAQEKFNVIRFQTSSPEAEQYFGYFLYRDGIQVVTGGGTQVENLGRLTLAEVMNDYNSVRKSRLYTSGSGLFVNEILRGGTVAGYTAADTNIEVGIWDITPGGKESGSVLQLVFDDTRGLHGEGTYRGRAQSGD